MKFKTNAIRFLFISILGVLLHFTYEWSDDNRIVGLFSAGRQLGGQRIHVGASEAALLPDASAHAGRAVLLP